MSESVGKGTSVGGTGRAVAVTGTTGFLGAGLVARLAGEKSCRLILALDPLAPDLRHEKVVHGRVDLAEHGAEGLVATHLRDHEIDCVVHLGFLSEPTRRQAWAHELEAIGTLNVLGACAEHGVRKVVMGSSTACYGPHPRNPNFLTETHQLYGLPGCRFMDDKVEAERLLVRHAKENPETVVTSLRMAPTVGPTATNWVTRYLSLPAPMTLMGHDPLIQLVHESDCIEALAAAVEGDFHGAFNIVGDGLLTLSRAIRICGGVAVPVPEPLAKVWTSALWMGQIMAVQPAFLAFLRYLCVADGARAKEKMGFVPRYSTSEALQDFAGSSGGRFAMTIGRKR